MRVDGATLEVIRSNFASAAEEMRRTLIRTAFNPVIYETFDFGISIYDANLELIVAAPGLALFSGANDHAIVKGIDHVGLDNLDPGDILVMNYPFWNGAHALDATLFAPVFAPGGKRPFAFTCIRAHWLDMGAKDPGYVLDSTDVHQEGLIFPGTKVYKAGEANREIINLIRFNSRMPDLVLGDMEAQVAATRTGMSRLQAIYEKLGGDLFEEAVARIKEHGEAVTRKALSQLPHGTWEAEDWVDDDGVSDDPIPVRVKVTIDENGLTCDFSESPPAVRGPVNVPIGLTETICKFVLKSITTPSMPSNAGSNRPLKVIAPEGNLFHAVYPSATFTQWVAHLALELIFRALSKGMPERVAACSGGDIMGFMMVGTDPETGKLYAVSNNDPVGWGGTAKHDGNNATQHISASVVRNTPIEVLEMRTGMLIEKCELRPNSGGAGKMRGGLGVDRDILFTADGEFLSVTKRSKERPWSLEGGERPEANAFILFPETADERRVGTFRTVVKKGDRVRVHTAGGAGFGLAVNRSAEDVRADILDGYITPQAARDVYGQQVSDE